jgi:hypothetical protein
MVLPVINVKEKFSEGARMTVCCIIHVQGEKNTFIAYFG